MAESTNMLAPQYNSAMPNNMQQLALPPQYQVPLDTAMLKKAIAQALISRGGQMPQGQTIVTGAGAPNRYVRPALTQNLGTVADTYLGGKMLNQALEQLGGTMSKYQADHQSAIQDALAPFVSGGGTPTPAPAADGPGASTPSVMSGAAGLPVTSPGPAPQTPMDSHPSVTADMAIRTYRKLASSIFPDQREAAAKLIPLIGELQKNESDLALRAKTSAFEAGKGSATADSIVANAPTLNAAGLKAPPKIGGSPGSDSGDPHITNLAPGMSMDDRTGLISTQNPQSGAISSQEGLPGQLAKQTNQKLLDNAANEFEALRKDNPDAMESGMTAAKARAYIALVDSGLLNTGLGVVTKQNAQQLGALFGGSPPPIGTSLTKVAQQLALSFLGAGHESSGVGAIRSTKEFQAFMDTSGATMNAPPPALRTIAGTIAEEEEAKVRKFNTRADNLTLDSADGKNGLLPSRVRGYRVNQIDIPDFQGMMPIPQRHAATAATATQPGTIPRVYSNGQPAP
jgi:hypothetical protein